MYSVLLPGFQQGRDSEASQGKGQGQFWPKKGQFASYRKNLKNGLNFTPFWVNKMFSHKF
jgi:hypothetical protein